VNLLPIWTQWISLVLAIVGSITGVWALVLNQQRTNRTKRQETERLEAKKKASFQVERIKEMGSKRMQDKFVLSNMGEATAKNVEVKFFNDNLLSGMKKQSIQPLMDRIPTTINSKQEIKCQLLIANNTTLPYEIIITWDDDFKENNKLKTTLN